MSPIRDDLVQDDTTEEKRRALYNNFVKYIKLLDTRDSSTLTSKEKKWKCAHLRKYESLNKREMEFMLTSNQGKLDAKFSSESLTVAPELEVNIINRNHFFLITTDKWLLLEKKIVLSLCLNLTIK